MVHTRRRSSANPHTRLQTHFLLQRQFPPRVTNLPAQWLQCQANGSNVFRVLGFLNSLDVDNPYIAMQLCHGEGGEDRIWTGPPLARTEVIYAD